MKKELRKRQHELFGQTAMLPDICMQFRMGVNGSGEPWADELVQSTLSFLKDVLAHWEPSLSNRMFLFDTAVYFLVHATIQEVEDYLSKK